MKEVEVKARSKNNSEVIQKLEALGCKLSDPIIQSDEIFVPTNITKLPTEVGVPVLRIREQGSKKILTLKIRLSNGLDKQESETEISDPIAMREIILNTGFHSIAKFTKTRRKTKYNNWEICVDTIEGLGDFVEAEEMTEDGNSDEIQKNLFKFLITLGIKQEDREHFGYDVLIWQKQNPL